MTTTALPVQTAARRLDPLYKALDGECETRPAEAYEKGKAMHLVPRMLYRVESGAVGIRYSDADGAILLARFVLPGEYFGTELDPGGTEFLVLARNTAIAKWEKVSAAVVWPELLADFHAQRLQSLSLRLLLGIRCFLPRRIHRALIDVANQVGTPEGSKRVLLPPWITHELLAAYIGTSREIVTCNCGVLERKHLLSAPTRRTVVLDVEGLEKLDAADA